METYPTGAPRGNSRDDAVRRSPTKSRDRRPHPSHQVAAGERAAHLGERLLLELADALARQVVLVADLLERELLLGAQPEALAQDIGLDRAQLAQQLADLGGQRFPLELAG